MSSFEKPEILTVHFAFLSPKRKLNEKCCGRCSAGLAIANKGKYCRPCLNGANIAVLSAKEDGDSGSAATPLQLRVKTLDLECN